MLVKVALLSLAAAPAVADTSIWLIGGGNTLNNSQGQIEANVRWLEDLLLARNLDVRTYFALGEKPGQDIVYWTAAEDGSVLPYEPLTRIFADGSAVGLSYKRHELRAVRGSTDKQELIASLGRDFAALAPGEEPLIVYNGHGGLDRSDPSDNYLKLWGDQRLSVSELEGLLDFVPKATPTRFVMTQCFSGAFHALIYDDPSRATGFHGNRCGFMAESALREAEGCDLSINQEEFRDYTTFFFAALSGATRLGEPLPLAAIDRNKDGAVSYSEAHFHALVAAHSSDLSRSTSEQYLENWTPWYLKWDTVTNNTGSIYWSFAQEIADRHAWDPAPANLERLRTEYLAKQRDNESHQLVARTEVGDLQQELRAELTIDWPELAHPYGARFHEILATVWPAIATRLSEDERYLELADQQRLLRRLEQKSLEWTRYLTQIEKIYRLRQLARLEGALQRYGNRRAKQEYAELIRCEAGTLK